MTVVMTMPERETETEHELPVYTPEQLWTCWRLYEYLGGPTRARDRSPRLEKPPKRRPPTTFFLWYAIRKADIDRLFGMLVAVDEDAANAISAYYKLGRPIDQIATREDRSVRTINYWIRRGIYTMARLSGWVDPEPRQLHPFKDEEE